MPACSAYGCSNRPNTDRKRGVSFFKFPREGELRQQWIDATGRVGFDPSPWALLCSNHFAEQDIDRFSKTKNRVRDGAVPTIFAFPPPPSKSTAEKKQIGLKRSMRKPERRRAIKRKKPKLEEEDDDHDDEGEEDEVKKPRRRPMRAVRRKKPKFEEDAEEEEDDEYDQGELNPYRSMCIIRGCAAQHKVCTDRDFHPFPLFDQVVLKDWIMRMSLKEPKGEVWRITPDSRICSRHFVPEDYEHSSVEGRKLLRKTAVPSVFPNYVVPRPVVARLPLEAEASDKENLQMEKKKRGSIGGRAPRLITATTTAGKTSTSAKKRSDTTIDADVMTAGGGGEAAMELYSPDPFLTDLLKEFEVESHWAEEGVIELHHPFEDIEVLGLLKEYLHLYEVVQGLKELARINVDLLYLNLIEDPESHAKEELDKVQKLVHSVMNGKQVYNLRLVDSGSGDLESLAQEWKESTADTDDRTDMRKAKGASGSQIWDLYQNEIRQVTNAEVLQEHLSDLANKLSKQQVTSAFSKLLEQTLNRALNKKSHTIHIGQVVACMDGLVIDFNSTVVQDEEEESVSKSVISQKAAKSGGCEKQAVAGSLPEDDADDNTDMPSDVMDGCDDVKDEIGSQEFTKKPSLSTLDKRKRRKEKKRKRLLKLKSKTDKNKYAIPLYSDSKLCSFCGRQFDNRANLLRHLRKHAELEKNESNKCPECGKEFKRKSILRTHMSRTHQPYASMCDLCGKLFKSQQAVRKHHAAVHAESQKPCPVCGRKITKDNLVRHIRNVHGVARPPQKLRDTADFSDLQSSYETQLEDAKEREKINPGSVKKKRAGRRRRPPTADGDDPNDSCMCDLCGKIFASRYTVKMHKEDFHMKKRAACPICGKEFIPSNLLRHIRNIHHTMPPPKKRAPRKPASSSTPSSIANNNTAIKPEDERGTTDNNNAVPINNYENNEVKYEGETSISGVGVSVSVMNNYPQEVHYEPQRETTHPNDLVTADNYGREVTYEIEGKLAVPVNMATLPVPTHHQGHFEEDPRELTNAVNVVYCPRYMSDGSQSYGPPTSFR